MDAATYMTLGNILPSEKARHKRLCNIWFCLYDLPRMGKSIEAENEWLIFRDWREAGKRVWLLMCMKFYMEENENVTELNNGAWLITS